MATSAYDNMVGRKSFGGGTPVTTPTRGTGGSSTANPAAYNPGKPYAIPFVQNPFLQQQVSQFGNMPSWIMDAYARKIGQMGGNANNPPFPVTQGGFPGVGGKPSQPNSGSGVTPGGTS